MEDLRTHDLRQLIAKGQLIVVVGAGVSLAATGGAPTAGWKGLLRDGIQRCRNWSHADEGWCARQVKTLEDGDIDEWINVAQLITRRLGGNSHGEFRRWLRESVGSLRAVDTSLLQAIAQLGCPIATTNYDDLLSTTTGLRPVSWDEPTEVERVLRGDEPGILHLHGHWRRAESVVLGMESYLSIRNNPHADAVRKALRMRNSLLFIGCGDTTQDPNMGAWIGWSGEVLHGSEYRSYRLEVSGRVSEVQALHPREQRIIVVGYGDRHVDLPAFVESLAPVPRAPYTSPPTAQLHNPMIALKARIRESANQLPWICQAIGAQLSATYIEIGTVAAQPAHQRQDNDLASEEAQPFMNLREALHRVGPRLALVGMAGSGKTTLLKQLSLDLLAEDHSIPITFHMQHVVTHKRWEAAFGAVYGTDTLAQVSARVSEGRAVLILDGMDEVAEFGDGSRELVEAVLRWAGEAPSCPIVISSREEGFTLPAGFVRLNLLPIADREAQTKLLMHLGVDKYVAETAIDSLYEDEHSSCLIQNPMMLTLVGLILLRFGVLPERRADLYEAAISCLLHREVAMGDGNAAAAIRAPAYTRKALELVCGALHSKPRDPWPVEEICRILESDRALCDRLDKVFGDPESWLGEQAKKVGLLVPTHAGTSAAYRVPHRTLREYLAACGLIRLLEASGWPKAPPPALEEILQATRQDPSIWAELLSLMVARMGTEHPEHVDQLLRWMVAVGHQDVAWRGFAETSRISPDTATALWTLGRGTRIWQWNWEKRQLLLRRLPTLIDDPMSVVDLVFSLVQETTHGADLYWAEQVLEDLGEDERQTTVLRNHALSTARRIMAEYRPEARSKVLAFIQDRGWWRVIPRGAFLMGSDDETDFDHRGPDGPRHPVTIGGAFEMLAVPVTCEMYEAFDPSHMADRHDHAVGGNCQSLSLSNVPVSNLTWFEAWTFARWLGCRLPFEVEWEYACRAGTQTRFWSGPSDADLEAVDWVQGNSDGHLHPVGDPPTPRGYQHPWGLFDLHGNVNEWCMDLFEHPTSWYSHDNVLHAPERESLPSRSGEILTMRVSRGGGYDYFTTYARSAYRHFISSNHRNPNIGFRLVRVLR